MDRETDKRKLEIPTPGEVFLWSVVAFAICVEVVVVVGLVLALFVAF